MQVPQYHHNPQDSGPWGSPRNSRQAYKLEVLLRLLAATSKCIVLSMNKIVQMLNAKECPCVFHLPMSGTWQRFTISQRHEGNSYDVNVSTVWVFKNHGVKITSRLKTSTLDGGCANRVALFLKTSLVKLSRAMSNYVCANDHSLCRANPHMRADVDARTYERTVTILQRQTHAACRCLCEGCAGPDVGAPSSDGVEYSWHRAYGINNRKGPAK